MPRPQRLVIDRFTLISTAVTSENVYKTSPQSQTALSASIIHHKLVTRRSFFLSPDPRNDPIRAL